MPDSSVLRTPAKYGQYPQHARKTGKGVPLEQPMAAKRDEIMTMDELAEYLKISKSTLYKLAVENKLPGQKVGKRWRFHKEAINEWLKQHPEKGTKK
jgi:excisionase family DNA binding protein